MGGELFLKEAYIWQYWGIGFGWWWVVEFGGFNIIDGSWYPSL